jgi:hypothetical protein
MAKWIQVSKENVAVVDDEDYDQLSKYHWHAVPGSWRFYAGRNFRVKGRRYHVLMHREITKCTPSMQVHHKDGDTMNNQRANLEICSAKQNQHYTRKGKKNA